MHALIEKKLTELRKEYDAVPMRRFDSRDQDMVPRAKLAAQIVLLEKLLAIENSAPAPEGDDVGRFHFTISPDERPEGGPSMTDSDRSITEDSAEDYAHLQAGSLAGDELLREFIRMQVAIAEVLAESRMAWADRIALSDAMRTNTDEYQGMCSEQCHLFGIGPEAALPERPDHEAEREGAET